MTRTTRENVCVSTAHATKEADLCRICGPSRAEQVNDYVIVEEPVTIMVNRVGSFTVMCTPVDIEALAVGFLFSEGMIEDIDDVLAIHTKKHTGHVVGVEIGRCSQFEIQRNLIAWTVLGLPRF